MVGAAGAASVENSEVSRVLDPMSAEVIVEPAMLRSAAPVPPPAEGPLAMLPPTMSRPADSTTALPLTSAAPAMAKPNELPPLIAMVIAVFLGTATM